jgi:5-hydroxyisourate hydrolase-like protein (transthyretin family)
VTWTSPAESDRAPIVAAFAKVCPVGGGECAQSERPGDGIARLPVEVAGPGEWTVSVWRRDAAGNADSSAASVPVTLRYDPEPPQVSFEASSPSDPTLVAAAVTDKVSGLAGGVIEISAEGSNTWQELSTQQDGNRLVARIDDSRFDAGAYLLRATARDKASNQASTSQRSDGQAMRVTLPLRIPSVMQAGVLRNRIVRRAERRGGRRRTVRRRITELRPAGGVRFGEQARIAGSLTNRDGQGIANAEIQVLATSDVHQEQLVGVLRTDQSGKYSYTAAGSYSRTLRFVYAGSPMTLPVQSQVRLVVPAVSSLRASRRRVLNGQTVTFSGRVRTLPIPAGGKLIQLEIRLKTGWQTFRTTRTDAAGRWAIRYPFLRTRGIEWYRFHVLVPSEAGYPFVAGVSKSVRVRVRGRR